jgi:hypothetical protein
VIVEVPSEIPDTSPVLLTTATAVSEELHGSTAEGVPVPESCEVAPLQNVKAPVIDGIKFTLMVSVVLTVHCPAVGVKV